MTFGIAALDRLDKVTVGSHRSETRIF